MSETIDDPVLGRLTWSDAKDGYVSSAKPVPCLGGRPCRFVIEGYAVDPRPGELHDAIRNMLAAGDELLAAAERHAVKYCQDTYADEGNDELPDITLSKPGDIWSHVDFGSWLCVSRRAEGDPEDGVYLSLECSCDWEREHGLQLVIREGKAISKLGPFDSHLTNSDAYGDPEYIGVIYVETA